VASGFERVREQTGDEAGASWSNRFSRHTELTRANKSLRPHETAEGERDSLFPRHYQGANLTGPRQSMVFLGTKRRTRRSLKPRFERDIRIDGGHGGIDGGHGGPRQMIKTG
jgi:N-acetylmuramoyl-L-alanine amidase